MKVPERKQTLVFMVETFLNHNSLHKGGSLIKHLMFTVLTCLKKLVNISDMHVPDERLHKALLDLIEKGRTAKLYNILTDLMKIARCKKIIEKLGQTPRLSAYEFFATLNPDEPSFEKRRLRNILSKLFDDELKTGYLVKACYGYLVSQLRATDRMYVELKNLKQRVSYLIKNSKKFSKYFKHIGNDMYICKFRRPTYLIKHKSPQEFYEIVDLFKERNWKPLWIKEIKESICKTRFKTEKSMWAQGGYTEFSQEPKKVRNTEVTRNILRDCFSNKEPHHLLGIILKYLRYNRIATVALETLSRKFTRVKKALPVDAPDFSMSYIKPSDSPQKIDRLIKQHERIVRSKKSTKGEKIDALHFLLQFHKLINDYPKVAKYFVKLFELEDEDQKASLILHEMIQYQIETGRYVPALKNLENIINTAKQDGDLRLENQAKIYKAWVFIEMKKFNKAERLIKEAMGYFQKPYDLMVCHSALGNLYFAAKKIEFAREAFNETRKYISQGKDKKIASVLLYNIARVNKDPQAAISLFNDALKLAKETCDFAQQAKVYRELSYLYKSLKRPIWLKYARKGLKIAEDIDHFMLATAVSLDLANWSKKIKDKIKYYRKFAHHFEQWAGTFRGKEGAKFFSQLELPQYIEFLNLLFKKGYKKHVGYYAKRLRHIFEMFSEK